MPGPLSHTRILDLSRVLAGPWASQILADLGADVIKVERPGVGDDTRGWGPPFLTDTQGRETRDAGYFLAVNRGKRSITLDLSKSEGQAIVRRLAARCDVVLENYKVGTLARYGLAYEQLKAVNPRLIYCSVTGFGQTGPRRDHAAYDFMVQATAGLMSVTGERDDLPGGGPQKVGVPVVDIMAGMYAAVAVLAALVRRAHTGEGEFIDIGMLDVGVAMLANQSMNYLISGKTPKRAGNKHSNIQPQDVFATSDGYVVLVVGNDAQFVRFCEAIGRPELASDERYRTNAERVRNQDSLLPLVAEVLRTRGMHEWSERLNEAGVPCGPINTIPDVFRDPQVIARGMLVNIPHAAAGTVPQVPSPMRFTEAPLSYERPPPLLGQHSKEILGELGLDAAEIEALAKGQVI